MTPQAGNGSHRKVGDKFGSLTILEWIGGAKVRCACDCGGERIAYARNLGTLTIHCKDLAMHRHARICEECGASFKGRAYARICSERCARKRPAKSKRIPLAQRRAVLNRDGWVCKLCNDPIPQGLTYDRKLYNPLYPSIDHIVPVAHGGAHDASNWQAAHMGCNSLKQHRA